MLKRLQIWGMILFIWGALPPAMAHPLMDDDFPGIVQKMRQSLVGVGTFQPLRRPPVNLTATGFVVYDGNHVITNFHAVPQLTSTDKERLVVIVASGRRFDERKAKIVALDQDHDLALLKFEGEELPAVKLGSGALVPDGTAIAVSGFPIGSILGIYPVTHTGIISAITPIRIPQPNAQLLDARMILRNPFDVYQLDLTAFPGNSGSPLYDVRNGRVIGILNSTFVKETKERALTDPTGISFAIPVIYVHEILKKVER